MRKNRARLLARHSDSTYNENKHYILTVTYRVVQTPICCLGVRNMFYKKPLRTSVLIILSLFLSVSFAHTEIPSSYKIDGVPRIKQLHNYCGPACVAAVMQHYGEKTTQEEVGKEIYDPLSNATNGADMLFYARQRGYASYSWNTDLEDVKKKLSQGIPVIVLQQNSLEDTSGHYRVLTGYDDEAQKFFVMDPYYDNITEMKYSLYQKLSTKMGFWALIVAPLEKDKFQAELGAKNPVVHMDLAYANYKRKNYDGALAEANLALDLEPGNRYVVSMVDKIHSAIGAGAK